MLTNADIDHILGLLLLREFQPLRIYGAASVRKILIEDNSVFGMLRQFPEQLVWTDIHPGARFELETQAGDRSGITAEPVSVSTRYPAYVTAEHQAALTPEDAVLGLILETPSRRKVAYFPGLPEADEAWLARVAECDLLLLDGTFWTDDELIRARGTGKTARQMGHLPLSGPDGTLAKLRRLTKPRKIFVHVNNTNPILDEASDQHRVVRDAGWEVGVDGQEVLL